MHPILILMVFFMVPSGAWSFECTSRTASFDGVMDVVVLPGSVESHRVLNFSQWALTIPLKLQSSYSQLGLLDLQDLVENIPSVQWVLEDSIEDRSLTHFKETAQHIVGSGKVTVSENSLNLMCSQGLSLFPLQAFFLHETLGALGYDDSEGGLSIAMALLASDEIPAPLKTQILNWLEEQAVLQVAGGTSVVGGGDYRYFYFKMDGVFDYLQRMGARADFGAILKIVGASVGMHSPLIQESHFQWGIEMKTLRDNGAFRWDSEDQRFYISMFYFIGAYRNSEEGRNLRTAFFRALEISYE